MTPSQVHEALLAAVGEVDFDALSQNGKPTVAYCEKVYQALRQRVPNGVLDVCHRYCEVRVEVRLGQNVASLVLPCE